MAGLIRREDIDAVRERARLDEVVGTHVTLRPAGVGSLKGLCPFHDERTPSFHVRPQVGMWHCFGCGKGGDVISFVQDIENVSFTEAVEMLAEQAGVTLRREEDGSRQGPRDEPGRRRRLVEAHRVAEEFYQERLSSPEAQVARQFLADRGFDQGAAARFGVGFAPTGWDSLLRHLRGRGFTEPELVASGLVSEGRRGVYDRFRGRLVWPIRTTTSETVGFGARRLLDEDQGPKYLNTPETALYKKSQVLYGLDLARRMIARERRVVVVEGYTDVMAAHLAGEVTAVATCGTAFGSDHVRIIRRLLGDGADAASGVMSRDGAPRGGEVIFTFDGDAAGQQAALRAFDEDQRFAAQTFVAISPDGLDPCDLRVQRGDDAVRALVAGRRPLFEFAIRSTLRTLNLSSAEGRVRGLRGAAPVVAAIRDRALRAEYARSLAGWLGMEETYVRQAVRAAESDGRGRGSREEPRAERGSGGSREGSGRWGENGAAREGVDGHGGSGNDVRPGPRHEDAVARLEREVLEVVLQMPEYAVSAGFDALPSDTFTVPSHRGVHDAVRASGGVGAAARIMNESEAQGPEERRRAA